MCTDSNYLSPHGMHIKAIWNKSDPPAKVVWMWVNQDSLYQY